METELDKYEFDHVSYGESKSCELTCQGKKFLQALKKAQKAREKFQRDGWECCDVTKDDRRAEDYLFRKKKLNL